MLRFVVLDLQHAYEKIRCGFYRATIWLCARFESLGRYNSLSTGISPAQTTVPHHHAPQNSIYRRAINSIPQQPFVHGAHFRVCELLRINGGA